MKNKTLRFIGVNDDRKKIRDSSSSSIVVLISNSISTTGITLLPAAGVIVNLVTCKLLVYGTKSRIIPNYYFYR